MDEDAELAALRTRVAELEEQNRALSADASADASPEEARPRRGGRGRSIVSAVALVLAAILVPVAMLGTWARLELVDTDRFVATFAPLAENPDVQRFVADQAVTAIDENLDIDGTFDNLFNGLAQLDLPDRAKSAIGLLTGPAVEGLHSLISSAVDRVVASPAFADIWERALRQTHSRAIAIIQGQPGTALQLADDGTLSIDVGVVIDQVKQRLQDQGVGIADLIPQVSKVVPITSSDALMLVRTLYQLAIAVGYWLPWALLGLLVVGVALARNRLRALAWTALGCAVALLLLAAGLGIGRIFFVGTVSPSIMPAATANVMFHQLTQLKFSTTAALILLSVIVAVGSWFAGRSHSATATRGAADAAFGHARAFADAHGMGTGRFGHGVERWRTTILVAAAVIAALAVFFTRPVTAASVVIAVVCLIVVALLVELLRRPEPVTAEEAPTAADPAGAPDGARNQPPMTASSGPRAK